MTPYNRAVDLLRKVATERGFLASANDIANYRRIWARDGVICGLAGLLDGDVVLVETMKQTLITLAEHQHERGMIPSNVHYDGQKPSISFGGLTGRVDTVAWFIIGVCQFAFKTGDRRFFKDHQAHIKKGLELQHSWEYNDGDLMNVPRSGNWADEYPTQGFILYDQLLRLWGIRCYLHFEEDIALREKAQRIEDKICANYKQNTTNLYPYHPKAFKGLMPTPYWVASLEPAGYQIQFDAFANSLSLLLGIGTAADRSQVVGYAEGVRASLDLDLLPAFWPVINEKDDAWQDLVNNCKYEFRNYPFEFHNGGTWQMVNGFYGLGLIAYGKEDRAAELLSRIHIQNEKEDWSFYENFNSQTGVPNGVPFCAWSAAAPILLQQSLNNNTLLT